MTVADEPSHARVFLSYSRKDMAFVDRLKAVLRQRGIESLIEDWWTRIENLIAQADTLVFALSPDAVFSIAAAMSAAPRHARSGECL
jgi:TIR domain